MRGQNTSNAMPRAGRPRASGEAVVQSSPEPMRNIRSTTVLAPLGAVRQHVAVHESARESHP